MIGFFFFFLRIIDDWILMRLWKNKIKFGFEIWGVRGWSVCIYSQKTFLISRVTCLYIKMDGIMYLHTTGFEEIQNQIDLETTIQ